MSRSASPGSNHALIATSVQKARPGRENSRPLYQSRVPAGFPSPADDYVETSLDLSEHLMGKKEATFFVRVAGDSMTEAGIHDGDILVVDRSVEPEGGSVVVAALDGELTVKRYEVRSGYPYLMPEADGYDPIPIRDGQELVVWGVVQHVVHEVS
jgi:DNA polymerase V